MQAPQPAIQVVHILAAGRPICQFTQHTPQYWPDGHSWVPFNNATAVSNSANCGSCLLQYKRIQGAKA